MRNTIMTIAIGIVLWAVALVFLIATNSSTNSIWICLVGIALGFTGLRYSIRRGRREGWK